MFIHLVKNDRTEIRLERSRTEQIVLYAIAVVVPLFFGIMMVVIANTSNAPIGALLSPGNVIWWIVAALEVLILWHAGPHAITFDMQRKTYRASTGPLFKIRSYAGSWADFYGLCLRPVHDKRLRVVGYRVDLDWQDQSRPAFALGSFVTIKGAEERQHAIAAKLDNLPTGSELRA